MSKGFITGTNEELIKAYKESRDESYLKELIEANKGLINLLVSPYLTSIPNSELEVMENGDMKFITKEIQTEALENHLNRLEKNIHKFSAVPDEL